MAKFISLFLFFIFIGCEIKNKQIIKPEKFIFDTVKFNTVSKILTNEFESESFEHETMSNLIQYWFDNKIKTNGLDGDLLLNVKEIQFNREKKQDYYKFSVTLFLEFIVIQSSSSTKSYNLNSNEYGEITGNFSIKDQENLDTNIMYQALKNISVKLKNLP